jgi:tRNA modification GTPase
MADGVFSSSAGPLAEMAAFRCTDGQACAGDGLQLPARAYIFRAPRSYTRQDVVELHLPGSMAAATAILNRLVAGGAAEAEAGEFTARAFFAGRIDLSAAEAVADMIHADDDAQRRAAVGAMNGRTHRLCRVAAEAATEALATIEAAIDLAEEGIQLDSPRRLAEHITAVADELRRKSLQATDMPDEIRHVHVALAGLPNVGKSSLVNALTGCDRSIVSAMAGTTRDVLSAPLELGDTAVTLQDAAGLADDDTGLATRANSAARRAVARADIVCLVVDAEQIDHRLLADLQAINPTAPTLILLNKIDTADDVDAAAADLAGRTHLDVLCVSAHRGDGLDAVKAELAKRLALRAGRSGSAMGLHHRQKRCLLAAADAMVAAAERLSPCEELAEAAELVAIDLRTALTELGQVSGDVVTEDILGNIFARFCVGK